MVNSVHWVEQCLLRLQPTCRTLYTELSSVYCALSQHAELCTLGWAVSIAPSANTQNSVHWANIAWADKLTRSHWTRLSGYGAARSIPLRWSPGGWSGQMVCAGKRLNKTKFIHYSATMVASLSQSPCLEDKAVKLFFPIMCWRQCQVPLAATTLHGSLL